MQTDFSKLDTPRARERREGAFRSTPRMMRPPSTSPTRPARAPAISSPSQLESRVISGSTMGVRVTHVPSTRSPVHSVSAVSSPDKSRASGGAAAAGSSASAPPPASPHAPNSAGRAAHAPLLGAKATSSPDAFVFALAHLEAADALNDGALRSKGRPLAASDGSSKSVAASPSSSAAAEKAAASAARALSASEARVLVLTEALSAVRERLVSMERPPPSEIEGVAGAALHNDSLR